MTATLATAILVVSVTLVAVAQVTFKRSMTESNRLQFLGAMALFGVAQIGFFFALLGIEVGMVYMATALTHVIVLVLSHRWLGERMERGHLVAAGIVALGVLIYGIG